MDPRERAALAAAAYRRALAAARAKPTPASWRRLLAAARNLIACAPAGEPRGRGGDAPITFLAAVRSCQELTAWRFPRSESSGRSPSCARLERWPEIRDAWERARALMAESRRLVEASHALGRWSPG